MTRVMYGVAFGEGKWDADRVRTIMGEDLAAVILSIPLSHCPSNDRLFWRCSKDGNFSVRSCYWLVRRGCVEGVVNVISEECWRSVWRLQCPPKLKHFLWCAIRGNMAIIERLLYRHITSNSDEEKATPISSFADRWLWLVNKLSAENNRKAAALMWACWRCRNLQLFEDVWPDPVLLAAGFCRLADDYTRHMQNVRPLGGCNIRSSCLRWYPPHFGMVKINTDAHVLSGNMAGLGVVCRNYCGKILMIATKKIHYTDPKCAEFQAIRYALSIARRFNYDNVWVESDALGVINTISHESRGFSPIFSVYDDIRRDRSLFLSCKFSYVKRNGNTMAHLVAREDTAGDEELIRVTNFPSSIVTLAMLDISN
ncbi:uncharacterized protein LOC110692191 [Chenopodium quinoa]|uniref:RNase H type-1 domain-containing protein n=1 Tax=Chenopodium quinoa TaxID=63459 RepID=A0A803MRX6_CHEQI|nr:uncharacterized protein LOC110692191 [Chenopodium quinoa]